MSGLSASISRMSSLEELAEKESVIHRLHPIAKLITTFVYLIVVISFGKYEVSGLFPFFIYPVVMMALGDIPYRAVLFRLVVALPFSIFAGVSNIFLNRHEAFVMWDFTITYGMLSFTSIVIKTVLTVMAVLILIASTPAAQIMHQLVHLRLPRIFILQFMLTYRYLYVLAREALSMLTAYHLRAGNLKGIHIKHMGTFIGQLLLKSFQKADRIYDAMKCRGFDGEYRFVIHWYLRRRDLTYIFLISFIFILMRFVDIVSLLGGLATGLWGLI